ncbi:hypothetical protein GGI17_004721 [Coemansia sp. S146]|nr:hypothetical protein GGI17_004721 [Coemansia sp. S146]
MWYLPPQVIDQPDNLTFHLAKKLVTELDMWSVCTDAGLESLSRVEFKDGEDLLAISPNAPANAAAFVKRILQMTPKDSEIEMVTDVFSDDSSTDYQMPLSDLLVELFHLATQARHISNGSHIILNQQMGLVRNLVHISNEVNVDGVNIVQLA